MEIHLYKKLNEADKMRKKGQFIYEKYCNEGECEVNIDESLRVAVKAALDTDSLEHTTFDNIQTHVFDLLWTDCFMAFRHTETYTNYLTERSSKGIFLELFFSFATLSKEFSEY